MDQLMANQAITFSESGKYEASNTLLMEILKKEGSDKDGVISLQLAKSFFKSGDGPDSKYKSYPRFQPITILTCAFLLQKSASSLL